MTKLQIEVFWLVKTGVDVFDFKLAVERKNAPGGTAPEAVKQQILIAKDMIGMNGD